MVARSIAHGDGAFAIGADVMTPAQLSIAFFLQVAVILLTCRLVGSLARRWLGQPRVVGEMIAGVVLGPSLFGAVAPDVQAFLFPAESKPLLFVIAQFGVGLYMFLVGLGFDRDEFRASARGAALVSFAGMAAPFLAAAALAPWMQQSGGLFAPQVTQLEASLFLGAAIAITAFPMLARIIHERGLSGSTLGTLSLSAGAIGDAGAWAVIALVLASFGGGAHLAWLAIGGGSAFALFMVFIAPRLLVRLEGKLPIWGEETLLAIVLVLYLLCAWAMDFVGIHAVFGGFLLGTAMPRGKLADMVRSRLEPVTVVLFLPFFFTYSGLHTQLTVLADSTLLLVSLAVLVASILSKGGASYLAARLSGQDNASALAIGALMNARGLMELIVINIGLQRGIIGKELFSILVLMAIVTTLMASPLFELVYGRAARKDGRL
ncbi:MAG: cation:proton antiporter [Novosphingobium sp.]